jgi:hypothetical protein
MVGQNGCRVTKVATVQVGVQICLLVEDRVLPKLLAENIQAMLQSRSVGWREPLYCPELVDGLLAPLISIILQYENESLTSGLEKN